VKTFEDFEERASSKHDAAADSGLEPTIFSVYLANTMTSVGKGAKPVVLPYSIIEGCNYQGEHFLLPMDVKYPKVSGPAKTEEIELNQWAADDLSVTIGDNVSATFFVSNSKGELVTRTVEFQVQLVVPLLGPALDRSFVPDFEGMTETKRIADWNPPFPIDLKLIRPKDEAYWDKYRTTPKAFVALDVIRDLWLPEGLPDAGKTVVPWVTAVELTRPGSVTPPPPDPALFTKNLLNRLSPADAGFVFRPIRAEALAAANAPTDFATLFLSMSFFLVASAAGLIVLLLRLTVDRRASQIGILLATGFTQRTASRIIVREALLVAFGGLVLGLPLGVAYASAIVFALKTSWSGAVAEFPLSLFVSTRSLLIGGLAGLFVSVLAILFSVRVLRRAIPLALLGGWQALAADPDSIGTGRVAKVVALVALLAAAILLGVWWAFALVPAPAAFALAGALLLVGLLALFSRLLKSPFHVAQPPPAVNPPRPSSPLPPGEGQGLPAVALAKAGEGLLLSSSPSPASGGEGQGEGAARPHGVAQPPSPVISGTGIPACQPVSLSLSRLAFRSASRHATRSLLTVGLLASATLIIVTVAAFQKNLALEYPGPKDSGSGGFRFLARSDIPIYGDLGSDAGRLKIGLPAGVSAKLAAARIYSFRENSGADISCLNLQRPKTPRVLGVPREFVERGGFAFTAHEPLLPILSGEAANVWTLLETDSPEGAIPAFADADTAQWQMHVGLGDEVSVPAPSGGALKLRIVGLLRGSIFAGELLVSEDHFTHALGAGAGFRFFLAECPAADEPAVRAALLDGLADSGLDVRRTSDVLAAYAGVENAYLSAFETLGGLGLVLATFGIVAVLLRSVIERRSELAMMLALGFTRRRVTRMVLLENGCLLAAGLVIGSAAALLAAAPQLVSTVADVRWMSLAGTLGAALAVGVASCAVAARLSVHGRLVEALRGE
jgi:hypothetical protein